TPRLARRWGKVTEAAVLLVSGVGLARKSQHISWREGGRMLRSINSRYASLRCWVALGAMLVLFSAGLLAQTTISTGSIQGTVTDSSGAVLSGAKVTITNKATGVSATTNTNGAGAFASGALTPAEYEVRIEAQGFKTQAQNVLVQLNTTSTLNAKMSVGES